MNSTYTPAERLSEFARSLHPLSPAGEPLLARLGAVVVLALTPTAHAVLVREEGTLTFRTVLSTAIGAECTDPVHAFHQGVRVAGGRADQVEPGFNPEDPSDCSYADAGVFEALGLGNTGTVRALLKDAASTLRFASATQVAPEVSDLLARLAAAFQEGERRSSSEDWTYDLDKE
jgi:hypothetical protein